MIKQLFGAVVAVGMLATTSSAVELKMKYEPGVTRTMNVEMNLKGDLDVGGDTPVKGTAQGKILTEMDLKVQSVDDEGVGTIEQSISNIDMEFSAEAETPDGPKKWDVDLSPEGGSMTADGETTPIPADTLSDIQSKSWEVKMNAQGAPVGMDIDSSEMSEEEAQQVKQMSESISKMIGKAALLPEGDVEVGHEWEQVLSIDELTKELVKDNPMLSVMTQMGIPDLKTTYKLDEVRQDGGNEIATISSKTLFDWTEGNLPLGVVNITVNRLSITGNTLTTMNATDGYASRQTSDTELTYDLTINTVFGPDGPSTFEAKGGLTINSNVKTD
ncbi:MAG: hypothetical protein KC917_04490 [Candidatus Omnitrophica bacterium]|nr:hypothetical protein [Candidatus Omnitrophota bacterium]MCA9415500.1 hypothetical protein [Candidatus Omnitrophota bacterium]MCA9426057.1 hypothetical protein [Candidatus Omnitrophota bacterium]MCA9432828.1 hypothetical protein [Candidatus Omnitrophota bacterium]MCA9437090.1 hypothetical protein [Candidatus Omnitrophota bacterium]